MVRQTHGGQIVDERWRVPWVHRRE
jgi:hypothetical protein